MPGELCAAESTAFVQIDEYAAWREVCISATRTSRSPSSSKSATCRECAPSSSAGLDAMLDPWPRVGIGGGLEPGQAAHAFRGAQDDIDAPVAIHVRQRHAGIGRPLSDRMLVPSLLNAPRILQPRRAVHDVEVTVAVDVAQLDALATTFQHDMRTEFTATDLLPQRQLLLVAGDDVEVAVTVDVADFHIMRIALADLVPDPSVLGWPRDVLEPLEGFAPGHRVADHDVEIAIAVDVGCPTVRGEFTARNGMLFPRWILVPDQPRRFGLLGADDDVEPSVAREVT